MSATNKVSSSSRNVTEERDEQNYSDNNHYIRLSLLLSNVGMRALRILYRDRYRAITKQEFQNGDLVGEMSVTEELLKSIESDCTREHVQEALDTGDIIKWDFTLLTHIIIIMGGKCTNETKDDRAFTSPSERDAKTRQEAEDEDLQLLWRIWCSIDKKLGQSLSKEDYGELWGEATGVLIRLGAQEKDIEHFRTYTILAPHELSTTAANADNESKSKALRAQAARLIAAGEFDVGVELYNKALHFNGLSAGEKSCVLYSRRKAVLDPLEDQSDLLEDVQGFLDIGMGDARLVMQLEPKGWKGYFLEGKVFQLQKRFKEALDSFEVALTLSPNSEDIIIALFKCKLELSGVESQISSDSTFTPIRLSEIFQNREEFQRLVTKNKEMMKSRDTATRVRGMLFMGHRYQLGDEVPLDMEKATELFYGAANEGSVEGAYNAGVNLLRGFGFKRCISTAGCLFQEAANHPLKGGVGNLLHNEAIAGAKAVLGMLAQNGIGRPRNVGDAFQLYLWAARQGSGTAAVSLSNMFSLGRGIFKDTKLALEYQKLAVEIGTGGAAGMNVLGCLYAEIGDLSQARYWSNRAITSGYNAPLLERQDFDELLQHKEKQFQELKKKLPTHVLSSKVPIHILHERYVKRLGPEHSSIKDLSPENPSSASIVFSEPVTRTEPNIMEVKERAAEDQEYARLLLEALKHRDVGFETLKELLSCPGPVQDDPDSELKMKRLALAEIAACCTAGVGHTTTVSMSTECRSKLMEVAVEFMVDVEGRRSDSDLHARICRLQLLWEESAEEALGFAKICKALYPEESIFHVRLAFALGLLGKHEEGVRVAEEGLGCFPNNWELLYTRAWHLCGLEDPPPNEEYTSRLRKVNSRRSALENKSEEEVKQKDIPASSAFNLKNRTQAFQEFLRRAPSGHPSIPEAHYQLAILYDLSGNVPEYEDQYRAGVEAEKKLLSHFLPYESAAKTVAEQIRKQNSESAARCEEVSNQVLENLLERDETEMKKTRSRKVSNTKRVVIVREVRRRLLSGEVGDDETESNFLRTHGFIRSRSTASGSQANSRQQGPAPEEIPSLMMSQSSNFDELDPTIDQVHTGRIINLTIMEEYIEGKKQDPIQTVVKDDNDEFSLIHLYNFDRSDPSTAKKLGFGSRIRLMNPYLSLGLSEYGGPVVRVDDPSSVLFLSSGEGNLMCRYCWKPNPGPRCTKCKTAQYCDKECQRLDWVILGHKDLCKILQQPRKCQQ